MAWNIPIQGQRVKSSINFSLALDYLVFPILPTIPASFEIVRVYVFVCVCLYVGLLWENIKKEVSEILSKLGFHNKTKGLCFATVFCNGC